MKFEHRRDVVDEVERTYHLEHRNYVVKRPVAIYGTPGLTYEGVLDGAGALHLLPKPGDVAVTIILDPHDGEPLS